MSEPTKIVIKIDEKVVDQKRQIFFNDGLSHHVEENEIQNLLGAARNNFWKSDANDGEVLIFSIFSIRPPSFVSRFQRKHLKPSDHRPF